MVIGGKAYTLLRNLLAPAKPAEKSFDILVKVMKDHLKPKLLVMAESFKFHHRSQHEGETVAQYLAELWKFSEQCDFKEYLEEALRDRLVCGLQSEVIQRRLLAEENLTLKKTYDIAHSVETANRQVSTKTAVAIQRLAPPKPGNAGVLQTCCRCGKTGNHPDRCFYKSQRCRACGKKGHIAELCKNSEKGVQNTPKHNPGVNGFKPFPRDDLEDNRVTELGMWNTSCSKEVHRNQRNWLTCLIRGERSKSCLA